VVPFVSEECKKGAGTYAEYVVVDAENIVPIPDGVDMLAAAQHYVNPITAMGMLKELDAPKGEYILQSAGGSTLGKQLVQIAKSMGLKTISTVRRCEQVAELEKYGADHVLCDAVEDLTGKIKAITGEKGAWGAVDAVAGDMTAALQMATRPGGTVLVYGALAGLDFKGNVVGSLS
jgi:NADPH:quinone reductase-like Zn-dependent oxidoreductase